MKKFFLFLFLFCNLISFGEDNLYVTVVGNNFGAPIKGIGVSVREAGGKNHHGITNSSGDVSFTIGVFHHFDICVLNPTQFYTKPVLDLMMPLNQSLYVTVTILGDWCYSQNQREDVDKLWETYFILPKKILVEMA